MEMVEGPINNTNDDCMLHMLNLLKLEDVLSFGATNKRFCELVANHFANSIRGTTIKLIYNQQSTSIIRLFGHLFRFLEVRFHQTAVPADLFMNEERCFIQSIINLRLCVAVQPNENHFPFENVVDEIEVLNWLRIYERSSANITNLLNQNNLLNMIGLQFKLSINLDEFTYPDFLNGHARFFAGAIHWKNISIFTELRRGNMHSDWGHIDDAYRFKFKLTFDF